jgi:hypothetical protein
LSSDHLIVRLNITDDPCYQELSGHECRAQASEHRIPGEDEEIDGLLLIKRMSMNNTIIGYVLLGAIILLKRFLPWPIGVLFLVGGIILGIDLMVPMWVEVAGYAAEGLAFAWCALLILRGKAHATLIRSAA